MCEDYAWQARFQEAVLETDANRLKLLVSQAEESILFRLEEGRLLDDDESASLIRVIEALATLKAERLLTVRPPSTTMSLAKPPTG